MRIIQISKSLSDIRKMRLTNYGKIAVRTNANIIVVHAGKEIFINAENVKDEVDKYGGFWGDKLFRICDKWGHPCYVNSGMRIIMFDGLIGWL